MGKFQEVNFREGKYMRVNLDVRFREGKFSKGKLREGIEDSAY